MVFKGLIAAASAVSLMAAPTVAAAQTTAPTVAAQSLAPAAEDAEGSELRGGFVIPVIAIILILLGGGIALGLFKKNQNLPVSP